MQPPIPAPAGGFADGGQLLPEEEVVTTDYIMELRCGMDTCIKTFKARQACIQQLLAYWEKGCLHDGFRYLGQLPNGKREAIVVDVLRVSDFQSLGLDLEGCALLLPLVTELLASKFEMCVAVRVVCCGGSELNGSLGAGT